MNDAILSLLIATSAGLCGLLIRYCFYSKCDSVKCCCIEIHRMVNNENTNPENNNDFTSVNIRPIVSPKKPIEEQKSIRI